MTSWLFANRCPSFRLFFDDAACAANLERARWPDGFACPPCGAIAEPLRIATRPGILACRSCRRQTGLLVGTVMERSHKPLSVWFWAVYLVTSHPPGMSGSLIVTDDWSGYASLRKRDYDHHAIAECGDPEVAEEFMPIVHQVFSNLKTWLNGIHHGLSAKHLQAYLNEVTFRFNRRCYPFNAFRSLPGIASDVEAPTFRELYSAEWQHPTYRGSLR